MGPRSYERGNASDIVYEGSMVGELQWGRVLMNAEITEVFTEDIDLTTLQWGRVLMNAEMPAAAL